MRPRPHQDMAAMIRTAAALALLGVLVAAPAKAQDAPAPDEIRNDTDPTKPVLVSLRDEHYNLLGDRWQNVAILRVDRLLLNKVELPGRSRGFLLRGDAPVVTIYDGRDTRSGLGDLYAQALAIPRFSKAFTIAWGTGLVFPTATHRVGGGKWQLAPAVGPLVFFGRLRGFGFVKVQDFVSVAGDDDRPDIHYMLVTPTVLYRVTRSWWIVADSESRTDWKRDYITSYKSGFHIGRMLSPRFGMWVKTEIPWGPDRLGDWTVKVGGFRTRF